MIQDFETFKTEMSLSKDEICRELYRQNMDRIRIKKETTATRNLTRIIDSTLRLANSKGFHAMTLRDLCADSGFSMGGLYAYIRNKDDLIHLIQSHGFMLTRRTVFHYISEVKDPADRLAQAIRAHLFLSELIRPWFYFSYMEAKHLPPEEKQKAVVTEREVETIFCDIISDGINEKVFRDINSRLMSSLIKAMLQDWYLKRRKYREQNISVETYADQVIDLLYSYLLPQQETVRDRLATHQEATTSSA
ncbi:transcriptional regulator, TetR family [Marinobacter daqiaonensis]|uniref:Transcriptional regulator, TetR family n=1 Tax=Marinobacter daqiaonensis TaxID=650891 RepID=A0A1I6IF39_9GAMM|nr:TetR/AcrR family transcriptional regulator [Marinobacter daqiaonensis]SFR65397.1 transcriptional regulator, TetR family [Marinobacter daqiaonensis]